MRVAACAAAVLLSGACIDQITNPYADEGVLKSISVSGPDSVLVGDTIRLGARGTVGGLTGLFFFDRLLDAKWSVSDASLAQLTSILPPSGDSTSTTQALVRGLRAGTVQVTARARNISGVKTVRVVVRTPP